MIIHMYLLLSFITSIEAYNYELERCTINQNKCHNLYESNNLNESLLCYEESYEILNNFRIKYHSSNTTEYYKYNDRFRKTIGKTNYYLGILYYLAHEYDKAIKYFITSDSIFYKTDSFIYLARIHSLKNDQHECMIKLLTYYSLFNPDISIIYNDKDFLNFRNSTYFNQLKKIISSETKGNNPKNKLELYNFLTSKKLELHIHSPSPRDMHFNKDGTFEISRGTNVIDAGLWHINSRKKQLILNYAGEIMIKDYIVSRNFHRPQDDKIYPININNKFGKSKNKIWVFRDKNPIILKIPFSKIFINRNKLFISESAYEPYIVNCLIFYEKVIVEDLNCGLCEYIEKK